MTDEIKTKLVSRLKEFFTFLFWADAEQVKIMMKVLNETAIMIRVLMPYMGWNAEIRTTINGDLNHLLSDEYRGWAALDGAFDIVPFMSETKILVSTANTYNGKPISAEYTIRPADGAGMSKLVNQSFKQFEDKVRREIYDMKKAGNFVDDSIEAKDSWETV
jgi:hypothetical protein